VNTFQVRNYLHVFVSTNSEWAIPATEDERRWFCLNMGEEHIKNFAYFKQIEDDMKSGGYENLLHRLLTLDLSGFEFRDIPDTEALHEQQAHTRSGVDLLVEEVCSEGIVPAAHYQWPGFSITSVDAKEGSFEDFLRKRQDLAGKALMIKRRLRKEWGCSSGDDAKRWNGKERVSGIQWPPLADLRAKFIAKHGPTEWARPNVTEWPTKVEPATGADDDGRASEGDFPF
jgi:hypothetical protein